MTDQFKIIANQNCPGRYMVQDTHTGWFFPNLSKIEAEFLSEKLNELSKKIATLTETLENSKFQKEEQHL